MFWQRFAGLLAARLGSWLVTDGGLVDNPLRSECVVSKRWLERGITEVKPWKGPRAFAKDEGEKTVKQDEETVYPFVVDGTTIKVNGSDWVLRLTLDEDASQLSFSLIGDESIALFQLRVCSVLDYSGFVMPFLATCHPGSVHYTMPLHVSLWEAMVRSYVNLAFKVISYRRNRLAHVAQSPDNETVWARAEILRVFPHSNNIEGGLKGLLLNKIFSLTK